MTSARITYCETQWVLKFYTSPKILYLPKTDFWLRPWILCSVHIQLSIETSVIYKLAVLTIALDFLIVIIAFDIIANLVIWHASSCVLHRPSNFVNLPRIFHGVEVVDWQWVTIESRRRRFFPRRRRPVFRRSHWIFNVNLVHSI